MKVRRRSAALSGWTLAAALAIWWLAGSALALERGADAGRLAAQAGAAGLLARALALLLLGLRVGAVHGAREGGLTMLLLAAPSWPVSLLAWMAGPGPLRTLLLGEAALLLAALSLPWVGAHLARSRALEGHADTVATLLGVALAATLWALRAQLPL